MEYKYLGKINSPSDVKRLSMSEKLILCDEIRKKIISTTAKNGGHLASNLGVVELTVAIHSVFESPNDSVIFDVGHQCYAHKLLTGRYDDFDSLRLSGGLSGFMKPCESEHDPVITGHSSTSISVALGIAKANTIAGKNNKSIAVIGDGAMTGGVAYEALNNSGGKKDNLLIILNDNKMSIGRNVGGFSRHLTHMRLRPSYYRFKTRTKYHISRIPGIGGTLYRWVRGAKKFIKNAIYHTNLFEDLGIHYYGPVDGHDLEQLINAMQMAKAEKRPVLIHTITKKGKGYPFAESSPSDFHGVSGFDPETGESISGKSSYSDAFGQALVRLGEKDDRICAVTAAMCSGTGLKCFSKKYTNRFFDVGIAEQHAVAFCAGLSRAGMLPVFAVYSSFLQRGYDQIIHDAAIGNMHIILAVDRAGIVGEDGETHHGIMDAAFLSAIPNVKVYSPSSFEELEKCLEKALYKDSGVVAIRYPRGGEQPLPKWYSFDEEKDIQVFGDKDADTVLVSYGREFCECASAEQLLEKASGCCVVKLNCISSIDFDEIGFILDKKKVYFYEEGEKSGGIGEHFAAGLIKRGFSGEYHHIAIPDEYVEGAPVREILEKYGLDSESITRRLEGGEA